CIMNQRGVNMRRKGFTLIELIVVMAIIGVLVMLAMPKYLNYTKEADITRIKTNLKELETASEKYYMAYNEWPKISSEPLTKEEIESYSDEIYNLYGLELNLEEEGKYYLIDQ